MEIQEFLKYRLDLIDEARNEDGFISDSSFISTILPSLLDAKLIDSEDFNETYYSCEVDGAALKVNGYLVNESGERLQLFILNEESINLENGDLEISTKEYYDALFKKTTSFVNKAIKGHLNDIQDIGAINVLINQISSSLGADQFDVVEVFLISATATVSGSSTQLQPKRMDFKDDTIKIKYTKDRKSVEKEVLILKRLIDLNFLYNVLISQGNRETLLINFEEQFNYKIEAIKAADETNFESFLCVMPAEILAQLYKRYSSRLLEKNVRSFLQFKGVNLGMRKTLSKDPEKFIAFNNGLTITASDKEIEVNNDKVYIKSLTDFQIVNGGQTTASIYFSQKDGIDVSKVKVMAKINVAKHVSEEELNELISNISQFSNSQSKVTNVDLRSRNPQLNKIKSLSDSVMMPSGRKWFFEKSKGEFNTKLRIAGSSGKNRIEKEYPKEFRFTKEQLGKYYSSWGNEPYNVKKGGEKIFRRFLEEISPDENDKKVNIDRDFYELLIARIILFKSLEQLHGSGNNSIGQLRSAVVPYTISILFHHTDGDKKNPNAFDLSKLWVKEGLPDDLNIYLKEMMMLINTLIKKYAKSDDLGEYSKKKELWDDISSSEEVKHLLNSEDSIKIFNKYAISKKDLLKKLKGKNTNVDFSNTYENALIYSKTASFYKRLGVLFADDLTISQRNKLDHIIFCINNYIQIDIHHCEFEKELTHRVRVEKPNLFDEINIDTDERWPNNLNYIIKLYHKCVDNKLDLISEFQKEREIAKAKGAKYYAIFDEIAKGLLAGEEPTIKQIQSVGNISFLK